MLIFWNEVPIHEHILSFSVLVSVFNNESLWFGYTFLLMSSYLIVATEPTLLHSDFRNILGFNVLTGERGL